METVFEPHKHVFERKWYPYNRTELWRQCVLPECKYFEVKKATS